MAPPSEPAPELEADVKAYASSLGFAPRASDGERGRGKKRAQTNDACANASQKATRDKANDGKKTSRDDGDGEVPVTELGQHAAGQ